MSFVCPIHGYYHPTPGVTVAICPQCQIKPKPATDHRIRVELATITGLSERVDAAEERARASEAETQRLRESLREIHAYLHLTEDQDHTRHGEACGADACILCLCESVARTALGDTSDPS